MIENQIPGDVNVVGADAQLREGGSRHVVDPPLSATFQSVFASIDLKHAYFCDFSADHPYYLGNSYDELEVAAFANGVLFDNIRLRSENPTIDAAILANTKNGIIERYLPWVEAEEKATGDITFAFTVQLIQYTPAKTYTAVTPTSNGFNDVKDIADDSPPANNATNNTKYKLIITPSVDIIVKGFGLMYDMEILE